jgi:hypothetical protein
MALEQLGDCRLAHTARLWRRRSGFPEFEQPLGAEVVFQCEQGREVAPELLTQAIGEAVPFNAEVLGEVAAADTGTRAAANKTRWMFGMLSTLPSTPRLQFNPRSLV